MLCCNDVGAVRHCGNQQCSAGVAGQRLLAAAASVWGHVQRDHLLHEADISHVAV